jgi:glycolate oxidase iron-sulfur subunit
MKSVLQERIGLTAQVVEHLDNCLSCLSCETTCPSGVRYSHLIDPMRARIEEQFRRPPLHRLQRKALALLLPHPGRFRLALRLAGLARPLAPLLPRNLRAMVRMAPLRLPARSRLEGYEVHVAQGARKARVALLLGCAQRVVGPAINDATIRFLTRIGCEVVLPREVGCCGALVYHLGNHPDSLPLMKRAIDAWYAELMNGGLDYIVINTSGCGSVVRDYGHIFRDDPAWREKAARVSAIAKDFSEVVTELGLPEEVEPRAPEALRVAYHDPCSLQHGQKVRRQPRDLLQLVGFDVVDVPEGHLCCGSAGTYNLLKPEMGRTLGLRKAQAIGQVAPQAVATGNVGCMEQIAQYSPLPVVHTAELLDWATGGLQPKVLRRKA